MSDLQHEFEQLLSNGPVDVFDFLSSNSDSSHEEQLAVVLFDQKKSWQSADPRLVEEYLRQLPHLAKLPQAVVALAAAEFEAQSNTETKPNIHDFTARFPEVAEQLHVEIAKLFATLSIQANSSQLGILRDRYRLIRLLGEGAFGSVYLALDSELEREVAVKVPTPERFRNSQDGDLYLSEARTVASLVHPNIVPVYDAGKTSEGAVFVVSRFVAGETLQSRLKKSLPTHEETAKLIRTISEALAYAHDRRLIHRDVKPANILIEAATNTAFITDFGLAIREEDYTKHVGLAGTLAYMSPEQARGEGHRLDGRSDVFALGIILYEMLTGQRPFRGSTQNEILHQVISVEPRAPRSLRPEIPAELERICHKALSKPLSDRYAKAAALAEDLDAWLNPKTSPSLQPTEKERITPKGLQSFDAGDANFFLDLLPGLRNRHGLPESIAFWKQRIEETDPEQTFSVGLIYGPSGCGKSSLVKAGLLPHLSQEIVAIYIEATPDETELRIARGLRKRFPELSRDASLLELFTSIRRGNGRKVVIILDQFEQWLYAHGSDANADLVNALRQCDGQQLQSILMVRDDFYVAASRLMRTIDISISQGENCAMVDLFDIDHAKKVLVKFGQAFEKLSLKSDELSEPQTIFVNQVASGLATDGKVVSVRLSLFSEMVKGKDWIPVTLLEVGGTQGIGVNFLEETFGSVQANARYRQHSLAARSVLKSLMPELGTDIKGHMRSVEELLEASGYRDRPSDFNELLRILDGELRLITPTDPAGDGSKSSSSPRPLGEGLRVRDSATQYFQLTHDYLVPSLREWLTRKQRETRKGRAELKLAERTSAWNSAKETKQLPTLWEWLSIHTLTDKKKWTDPQRTMMRRATNLHGARSGFATIGLIALVCVGSIARNEVVRQQEATRIEGLVGQLVSADPNQIPGIIKELDANRQVAKKYLLPLVSSSPTTLDEKRSQLHARLAMVSGDPSLREPLAEELLSNKVVYVGPIRQQLRPWAKELTEKFRDILREEKGDAQRRFRAALTLAEYVPESDAAWWTEQDRKFIADQLVSANAEFQSLLREYLRPMYGQLLANLEKIFGDPKATDSQRLGAANAFADYSASDIAKLSQLLAVATPEQYSVLYPLVAASPAQTTVDDLSKIASTLPLDELGSVERVPFGQRRANAAVTLLRLGEREKVLPVFEMTDDPEALTQFIFRCRPRGVNVDALLDLLQIVSNERQGASRRFDVAKYAIILAIGEFALTEIAESRRETLLKQLSDTYRNDPSSGVHGAAGWLLRQWDQTEVVREVDQTPVPYSLDREWFTLAITVKPTSPSKPAKKPEEEKEASESASSKAETPVEPLPAKTFHYTFIVFPAGESKIGSLVDETDRGNNELRHTVTVTRPFALLDREVTFEELIVFAPKYAGFMKQSDARPEDAGYAADWYDSVAFSRWLGQESGLAESDQSYAAPESLDKKTYPREPNPVANWAPRDWPLELGRRGFRLPTESEWELASRAGALTAYGYGSDMTLLGRFGWFQENSGKHVHPPRELRPTIRGLFDLHGNLYEWTHDWFSDYEADEIADPIGANRGSNRVLRGGGWRDAVASCRSAYRYSFTPAIRSLGMGFRLALSPSIESSKKGAEPVGGGTEGASAEQRPEMP